MSDELDGALPELQAGATLIIDDGCDWTAWLIWSMNNRRRISERKFVPPPVQTQVVKLAIKHKRKGVKRGRKAVRQPVGAIYPDSIQKEAKNAH